MSDMMQMGGQPGAEEAGANMDANRSILNPTDAAFMADSGRMQPGQTVGQFIEALGVKWEDPLPKLGAALQSQLKNRTPTGKMEAMAQGGQPPMPPGMPQGQPQGQPPGGMEAIMSQMG